jgi:hypothetical protein
LNLTISLFRKKCYVYSVSHALWGDIDLAYWSHSRDHNAFLR